MRNNLKCPKIFKKFTLLKNSGYVTRNRLGKFIFNPAGQSKNRKSFEKYSEIFRNFLPLEVGHFASFKNVGDLTRAWLEELSYYSSDHLLVNQKQPKVAENLQKLLDILHSLKILVIF